METCLSFGVPGVSDGNARTSMQRCTDCGKLLNIRYKVLHTAELGSARHAGYISSTPFAASDRTPPMIRFW
jgi:hypothetical protein